MKICKIKPNLLGAMFLIGVLLFRSHSVIGSWEHISNRSAKQLQSLSPIKMLGRGKIESIDWSPNGEELAVGGQLGVWLYTSTLEDIDFWSIPDITALAWSPNGHLITVADEYGVIQVLESSTGELLWKTQGHSAIISAIAWNKDGTLVATSSYDDSLKLWNASTGELIAVLEEQNGFAVTMSWNPEGSILAIGRDDGSLQFWDTSRRQLLRTIQAHRRDVDTVAWSHDGSLIASAGYRTINVWNAESDEGVREFRDIPNVFGIEWSLDDTALSIVTFDDGFHTLDINTDQEISSFPNPVETIGLVKWNHQGTQLATVGDSESSGVITIWDAGSFQPLHTRYSHYPLPIESVAWQPHGNILASAGTTTDIMLWNVDTEQFLRNLETTTYDVNDNWVEWHPGGTLLLNRVGYTFEIWETITQGAETIWQKRAMLEPARAAAWGPDGTKLAFALVTGPTRETIMLYDLVTRSSKAFMDVPHGSVSLAWSSINVLANIEYYEPNNSRSLMIQAWDMGTGQNLYTFQTGLIGSRIGFKWSPKGDLLAVFDLDNGITKIFNFSSTDPLLEFEIISTANDIAWSPDGNLLAIATDRDIAIWDIELREQVMTLVTNQVDIEINAVAWDTSGSQIAAACSDRLVRIWSLE